MCAVTLFQTLFTSRKKIKDLEEELIREKGRGPILYSKKTPGPNRAHVSSTSLLKTVLKGEIARNEQFLVFQLCFLLFLRTFCHFIKLKNCRLQAVSDWKSLKFVVWEQVNLIHSITQFILQSLFYPFSSYIAS